jgi:hypothetical protein
MKKLLLTICLATATLTTFAQFNESNYPSVTFGIMGGVNTAFLQAKLPQNSTVANNPVYPASFGVNADFRFSDYLSVRPGIFYSGKGGDIQYIQSTITGFGSIDQTVEQNLTLNYLEIPVNIIGHIPLNDNFNILVGAGPYIAMGLNGKVTTSSGSFASETDKVSFGKNGDFKSTDFGAATMLGFETARGLIISINYDMGLTNIMQNASSDNTLQQLKTGAVYVSVGFALK